MKSFWDKYSEIIILILLAGVAVTIIYFSGKKKGKQYRPEDVVLPPDNQGSGNTDTFSPAPYTDAIKDEIYSWGFRDATPLEDINSLSNSKFVAVYNDWNKRYYGKDKETLVGAIKKESSLWNYAWDGAKLTFINKAQTLNLV